MKKTIAVAVAVIMMVSCAVFALAAAELGDVNNDNKVTAIDARIVLQVAVGLKTLTDSEKEAADFNGDGKITAIDARGILKKSVGITDEPTTEEPTTEEPTTEEPTMVETTTKKPIDVDDNNSPGGSIDWDDIINPK